ncbi:MAG: glycoside hydrolase family 28 protein [Armatimonadota bacterium]|nr:glycoside hydrolase family 28 protein [Armatimonadota bacterium]
MPAETNFPWRTASLNPMLIFAALLCSPALLAAASVPTPELPRIPARTFRVQHGGAALDTAAFQKAIADCTQAGGGVIDVLAGRYHTGPLTLGGRTELRLEAGATIRFEQDPDAYQSLPKPFRAFLTFLGDDVALTGAGTIDGQGAPWWTRFRHSRTTPGTPEFQRPRLVAFNNGRRVLVRGVALANSPSFHLVPSRCEDVTIENITITAPADSPNTDGMDPSLCRNMRITGCRIDVGDDNIAVKSGKDDPAHPLGPSQNLDIRDCTFLHGHGLSIGSETNGGVRGMTVERCTFDGTVSGIRMKSSRGRGGTVENLTYSDITMKNVRTAIDISSYYPHPPKPGVADSTTTVTADTLCWRNIQIRNVTATGGRDAGLMVGLPEMPLSNITLENVHLSTEHGLRIDNARGVHFVNTQITTSDGKPALALQNAEVKR